jgi:hypothetical protein
MNKLSWLLPLVLLACGDDEDTDGDDDDDNVPTDTDTTDTDTDTDTVDTDDTDTTPPDPFVFATDPATAYLRVDRMGMPAVATAVIATDDAYNAANPTDDIAGDFVGEITASVEFLHNELDGDLAALVPPLTPCGTAECVNEQAGMYVLPDTLTLDTTIYAAFPNGRLLEDPAIDLTLALLLLDLDVHPVTTFADLPLNPPANDVPFPTTFPYLAPAH